MARWRWPCIEAYLDAVGGSCRPTLLHELIKLELELRVKLGELPTVEEYCLRFPGRAPAISELFREMTEPGEDAQPSSTISLVRPLPTRMLPRSPLPPLNLTQARPPTSPRSMARWDDFSAIT